jgi:anaphase-promoting complex subunit 1
MLETLPEGIVAPLREAITQCQSDPMTTWDKKQLDLIGRDDVKMLLSRDKVKKEPPKSQMASTLK